MEAARRGARADPRLIAREQPAASASSTAATVGRRSRARRREHVTGRGRVRERADDRARGHDGLAEPRDEGDAEPGRDSAIVVWKSSVRCTKPGAKPAAAQPVIVTSWQGVPDGRPDEGLARADGAVRIYAGRRQRYARRATAA